MAGCHRPVAQTEDDSTPNLATDTQAAPIVARPSTPPPPEYAPRGVFYLLASVRKETKDGIIRLLPGTEVKLVRNGKYLTPEGEMALDPKLLTNDMARARAARDADRLAQNAAMPQGLPPTPPAPIAPAPTGAPLAASVSPTPAAADSSLAAITAPFPGAVNGPAPAQHADTDSHAQAMRFRLSTLKSEESKLQANIDFLNEKAQSRPHINGLSGLSGSTNLADWDIINTKLAAVRAEIQALENQMAAAN